MTQLMKKDTMSEVEARDLYYVIDPWYLPKPQIIKAWQYVFITGSLTHIQGKGLPGSEIIQLVDHDASKDVRSTHPGLTNVLKNALTCHTARWFGSISSQSRAERQ